MKKKKQKKSRNPIAALLSMPMFKSKQTKNKKKVSKKPTKKELIDYLNNYVNIHRDTLD